MTSADTWQKGYFHALNPIIVMSVFLNQTVFLNLEWNVNTTFKLLPLPTLLSLHYARI